MLPLPEFDLVRPRDLADALRVLDERGPAARLVAGGTDLLVAMKNGLAEPECVVDLSRIAGVSEVEDLPGGGLRIGAMGRLGALAADSRISARYPALAQALASIGSPQIRAMGTLGGNVCLPARCAYYNRSPLWRQSLGYCLRKDGDRCHVVPQGQRCVAALCSDTVPVLSAYRAVAIAQGIGGERRIDVESLNDRDGAKGVRLQRGELLTHIELRPPAAGTASSWRKLRLREAIDFPLLGIAAVVRRDSSGAIQELELVGGRLGPVPRRVKGLDDLAQGRPLTAPVITAVAHAAKAQLVPLPNMLPDLDWRRAMVPVLIEDALRGLVPSGAYPS